MSKLNISENLFLDVNELNHLVRFLEDDGYKRIIKQTVKNYGIVQNTANSNFAVTKVDDNGVTVAPGLAFDENLDAIVLRENKSLTLQNNVEHYICIRRSESHIEDGTVNISSNGVLTGLGTKFTDVLRGQPNFPTKVKFYGSSNNTQEYEVVNVTNNTNAMLAGDFVAENNLKYSVVGTFTPGAVIDATKKEIYTYDDCEVFVIDGDGVTTPTLNTNEYFVAKITYSSGILYITDIRYMNIFNYESVQAAGSVPFVNLINIFPKNLSKFTSPAGPIVTSEVELLMEFCYFIDSFTVSGNTITINSGVSNKYPTINDAPDGVFNGCYLFNKTNNTKALIADFTSGICTLIDSNIQIGQSDELYIIPNADEIEFELVLNTNSDNNYKKPLHFRSKIDDCYSRIRLVSNMDGSFVDPEVKINYRLINNNTNTLYSEIDACNYLDGIENTSKLYTVGGILIKVNALTL